MLSVGYLELARKGNFPTIEMGQLDEGESLVEARGGGARLRVFFSGTMESRTALTAPFALFDESLALLKQMARPDSALREHVADVVMQHRSGEWLFLEAKRSNGDVKQLPVESLAHLTLWLANLGQVLAVGGEPSDLLGLLDSIGGKGSVPSSLQGSLQKPIPEHVPLEKFHQAAIDFRNELLAKGWPDGRRVAEMAGASVGKNPAQYAARLRSSGALLGVWDAPERTFRHPDFQFDAHGLLRSEVAELLALLPGADDDRGGWRRAFWLYSPHGQLGNETPAAVFPRDARRVIEVARGEFCGDRDARW